MTNTAPAKAPAKTASSLDTSTPNNPNNNLGDDPRKPEMGEAGLRIPTSTDPKKTLADAKTAKEADEHQAEADEKLLDQINEDKLAAARASERARVQIQANQKSKIELELNPAEERVVRKALTAYRLERDKKDGIQVKKTFLVNSSGADRVRYGGVSYRVPEGRHEVTPDFLDTYFPASVTLEDLQNGLLGAQVKVEYEYPNEKKADDKK